VFVEIYQKIYVVLQLYFFFFKTANIVEPETLARRKEAEKKYKDAAYRHNIQKFHKNHLSQSGKTKQPG